MNVYDKLTYLASYYNSYKMKSRDVQSKDVHLIKTNLDTMAMLLNINAYKIKATQMDSSTMGYFFSRMDNLSELLNYIILKKNKQHYIPTIYDLCNLNQRCHTEFCVTYLAEKHRNNLAWV